MFASSYLYFYILVPFILNLAFVRQLVSFFGCKFKRKSNTKQEKVSKRLHFCANVCTLYAICLRTHIIKHMIDGCLNHFQCLAMFLLIDVQKIKVSGGKSDEHESSPFQGYCGLVRMWSSPCRRDAVLVIYESLLQRKKSVRSVGQLEQESKTPPKIW